MPVLFATTMAIPVSIYGTVKSTTASRSELIIRDVITMSVFRLTKSAIKPFHFPFYKQKCTSLNRQFKRKIIYIIPIAFSLKMTKTIYRQFQYNLRELV